MGKINRFCWLAPRRHLRRSVRTSARFSTKRLLGYWVLKDTPAGRKVFRMQACQDYQGDGKYGKLKYHAVGGGQYFVE